MLNSNSIAGLGSLLLCGLMTFSGSSLATPQADAFLKQSTCRNFVRHVDGFVLLGADDGLTTIDSSGTAQTISLGQSAQDALLYDGEVIALVGESLVAIDRQSGQTKSRYNTQPIKTAPNLLPQEKPRALGLIDQTLIVAHGTLGVVLFDLTTHQIEAVIDINRGQKLKGMAQDIMIRNDAVYVLVDNYQMNPLKPSQEFRGLVRLDLGTRSVAERFAGLDPGSTTAAMFADTILVSFAGMPLWRLDLPLSSDSPLAAAAHPVSDFGRDGHPVGHIAFDDQLIWTCHRPATGNKNVPAVYQRTSLDL